LIGAVFEGRYTVNGFLAEGPIFTLYSARDKLTAKDVSLRQVKSPFDGEDRFKKALSVAIDKTALVRSNFVERLIELSNDDGKVFVIGELTRAPSLADRIRKLAPFTPSVSVSCAVSIVRGLEAFHKMGLAHGDISGDNIALLADGETRLQLGGVWEAYSASATAGFLVLPSLAPYLAPEISNGDAPNACSDLYAVGILLYELLTGRKPYLADTGLATAMRHSTEETPRVRNLNPSIPVVLDEIVFKAMSKNPSSRYRTANEMIFDLRQTQDALRFGRTLAWPISGSAQAPQPKRTVQVAPRMSAVREREPVAEREGREKADRDVPVWMLLLLAGAVGVAATLGLIDFFIGANRPRLVVVPNLAGLSLSEAKSDLAPMKLKARLGDPVASNRYEADRVVSSVPPSGEKISEDSTVVLSLSLGSSKIQVPQLKNLTPDKARQMLSTVNLSMDDHIDRVNDPAVADGSICKQSPIAGDRLARSGKVRVSVSDHSLSSPHKNAKHYLYTLHLGLMHVEDPTQVRIDIVDDDGTRTIFDEQKNPDDTFTVSARGTGEKATFIVYYDGKEVLRKEQSASDSTTASAQAPPPSTTGDGSESPTDSSSGASSGDNPTTPP
jgi:hypothetical protein